MNLFRTSFKNNTLYKFALGAVVAMAVSACATEPPLESREPACTRAGYFKSTNVVGGYHRCVFSQNINRWIQYPFNCPAGLEFDESVGTCVRP
ncbi:hypothetical protein C4J89_2292 [Pseudomonas sp. R4-35-07]|nr:hypothetical protein C4J89_2292 [Pseudomonas sp. R4-35-07]